MGVNYRKCCVEHGSEIHLQRCDVRDRHTSAHAHAESG